MRKRIRYYLKAELQSWNLCTEATHDGEDKMPWQEVSDDLLFAFGR